MFLKFLDLLRCPGCRSQLELSRNDEGDEREVVEGELRCASCSATYAIRGRIPIFVPDIDYVDTFGWQWNRFAKLGRDSYNGTSMVRDTILLRSGWEPEEWAGKTLLECGCGAGYDTEVLLDLAETVISFDLSSSVVAFRPDLLQNEKLLVMRADATKVPLADAAFDIVYCHRMIMHTPEPRETFRSIVRHLGPGGRCFLHSYGTHWKNIFHFRYVWRWLTKRLPMKVVYYALRVVGIPLYLLVGALNRLAFLRRVTKLLIPFENLTRSLKKKGTQLTWSERYNYSFLATFDALTPWYDQPNSSGTIVGWCQEEGLDDIVVRSDRPVVVTSRRPAGAVES